MLTHALTRPNRDELHNLVDRLVDAADGNRAQGEEIPTTQQHPTTEVSERRPVCSDTASQQQSDEIHRHRHVEVRKGFQSQTQQGHWSRR